MTRCPAWPRASRALRAASRSRRTASARRSKRLELSDDGPRRTRCCAATSPATSVTHVRACEDLLASCKSRQKPVSAAVAVKSHGPRLRRERMVTMRAFDTRTATSSPRQLWSEGVRRHEPATASAHEAFLGQRRRARAKSAPHFLQSTG